MVQIILEETICLMFVKVSAVKEKHVGKSGFGKSWKCHEHFATKIKS